MTHINKIVFILIIAMAGMLISCDKNLDKVNIDPNAITPDKIKYEWILSGVMGKINFDVHIHERMTVMQWDAYVQYQNEWGASQTYYPYDDYNLDYWSSEYHANWIKNLNEVISHEKAAYDNNSNLLHIARILKCVVNEWFTDSFGNVPYFNFADGSGLPAAYDNQEDIYTDMFKELREAEAGLNTNTVNTISASQDILYGGDIEKWKRLANSLRLRFALKISLVKPDLAKTEAEDAVTKGVFRNTNDALVTPASTASTSGFGLNANGYYYYSKSWGGCALTRSFENLMVGLGGVSFPKVYAANGSEISLVYDDPGVELQVKAENLIDPKANKIRFGVPSVVDPRGPIYFNVSTPASWASGSVEIEDNIYNAQYRWVGMPSGLSPNHYGLIQYNVTDYPRMGDKYTEQLRPYTKFGYEELCFLLAEAALKNWNVGGSAKEFYEAGIKASMEKNAISSTVINQYLASTDENIYGTTVNFQHNSGKYFLNKDADDALNKIITQKYIAMFPDGSLQAWNDMRRLNLPYIIPYAAPDPTTVTATDGSAGNYIKRMPYPIQEQVSNPEHYKAALDKMGGEDLVTKNVWWDVD